MRYEKLKNRIASLQKESRDQQEHINILQKTTLGGVIEEIQKLKLICSKLQTQVEILNKKVVALEG